MTNTEYLEEIIEASGLKKGYIAEKLGISRYGLSNKIANKNEFKASEINSLCEILNISKSTEKERLFFAKV